MTIKYFAVSENRSNSYDLLQSRVKSVISCMYETWKQRAPF